MDGISRIGAEGIFVEPVKYEGFKYTLYDSTKAHRLGPLSDKSVQVYRCHSTIYINADDSLLFNWCFLFYPVDRTFSTTTRCPQWRSGELCQ